MKLLYSLVLSVLFVAPAVSQAQIGVYVNPIATRVSTSKADTGVFAFMGDGVTSRTFWGVNMGGYYDRWHGKKYDFGVDFRDTYVGANNARMNEFLLGGRFVMKSLSPSWRPYVQLSGGAGTTRAPHSSVSTTRAAWNVYAGADYHWTKVIDIKVMEIGYGNLTTISSASVGSSATSLPSSNLLHFSAGLVFRIR